MKYAKGFYFSVFDNFSLDSILKLKGFANLCDEFIIGIPSSYIMARIYNNEKFDAGACKTLLSEFKFVTDVVIVEAEESEFVFLHKKIGFDVYFYGSEYGKQFEKDKLYASSHNITLMSVIPPAREKTEDADALRLALNNVRKEIKIILFGTGKYFEMYMAMYGKKYKPAYAVDTSPEKIGKLKNGIEIKNIDTIKQENPDDVLVVFCAKNYESMRQALLSYGDYNYRAMVYENSLALVEEFALVYKKVQIDEKEQKLVLEKVHKINYELLKEFDTLCRKHKIEYFLNFGSLIGALRHQAIIPWDNDVDTVLKRSEWDKVKKYKDELGDNFFWLGNDILGGKKYFDCIDRIGYKNAYIKLDEDFCKYYKNYFNSIHLDMFLIDKTYDNFWGKLQRYELAILYGLMNAYRHKYLFSDYNKKMNLQNNVLCFVGKFFSLKWLKKRADKVARRFDNDKNAPYYFISNDVFAKLMMLVPVNVFEYAVDTPFGCLTSKIPCKADIFCKITFGDYMKLPPVSERVPHCGRIIMTANSYIFETPVRE